MRFKSVSTQNRKHIIRGRPTQRLVSVSTLTIQKHILHRRKPQLSLKCRIKGCSLAYVSFKTYKDLNAHHHIYHPTYFSSARAVKKDLPTLVLGKIINMAVVDRSCTDVIVVTNDFCSAVRYGNTTEATHVKNFSNVSMANAKADTNTHRIWSAILLHTMRTDLNARCAINLLVRNAY